MCDNFLVLDNNVIVCNLIWTCPRLVYSIWSISMIWSSFWSIREFSCENNTKKKKRDIFVQVNRNGLILRRRGVTGCLIQFRSTSAISVLVFAIAAYIRLRSAICFLLFSFPFLSIRLIIVFFVVVVFVVRMGFRQCSCTAIHQSSNNWIKHIGFELLNKKLGPLIGGARQWRWHGNVALKSRQPQAPPPSLAAVSAHHVSLYWRPCDVTNHWRFDSWKSKTNFKFKMHFFKKNWWNN